MIKIVLITILILIALLISRHAFGGVITTTTINGKVLTTVQYNLLKTSITGKFDTNTLSFSDGEDWKTIMANEVARCGSWVLTNVKDDLMNQLNAKLKSGKC